MRPVPSIESGEAGVALIEVLVARALTALITGVMTGYFGQLGRIGATERDAAAQDEFDAAWDYVAELRTRALRLLLLRDNWDRARAIEITSRYIRFTAHVPAGLSGYVLRRDGAGLREEGRRIDWLGADRKATPPDVRSIHGTIR